jgi:hypothetical protein
MSKNTITIPPDAIDAALRKWLSHSGTRDERMEAACLAMLSAWPRMEIERFAPWSKDRTIHLPLPQEARDE